MALLGRRKCGQTDIVGSTAGHEVDKDAGDGDHLGEEAHEDDAVAREVESLDQPAAEEGAPSSGRNHDQANELGGHPV